MNKKFGMELEFLHTSKAFKGKDGKPALNFDDGDFMF